MGGYVLDSLVGICLCSEYVLHRELRWELD